MNEKNSAGAPDLATVVLITLATFLSAYNLIGVVFWDFTSKQPSSESFIVLTDISFLLWFIALACFKFPVTAAVLYWLGLCAIAAGLMADTHTGNLWGDLTVVARTLLYFLYAGLLLSVNIANVFLGNKTKTP